jgi:hypothetical protein
MGYRVGWHSGVVFFLIALGCSASGIKSGGTGGAGAAVGGGGGGGGGGGADGEGTGGVPGIGIGVDDGGGVGVGGMAGLTDGPMCGVRKFSLAQVPPDLVIVLDKSGSMRDMPDNTHCDQGTCGPASKWAQMTAAINQVVMSTENAIRWGIEFFPADDSCAVETMPAAPIADMNAGGVAMAMAATEPSGGTPTRAAINAASLYAATLPDPNPKYVLVATDGFPNCMEGAAEDSTPDAPGTIQAVTDSAARGIPVFVVGIGMVPQATATLTAMAVAGGEPQAADPRFYPVSSTADLVSVLGTIGGMIGSCSFALGVQPPDPNNISVVADGARVPQDLTHTEGWDYGTGQMSLQLFGHWCDDAKAGTLKDVEAIFGCPGIVIP